MRWQAFPLVPVVFFGCAAAPVRHGLVDLTQAAPGVRLDIRYAGADNVTGRALYPAGACYLRADAARRLARVQKDLAGRGLGLKLFDCYRPLSVQRALWEKMPDERYVANPAKGSRHNRGCAVDLTLVDAQGRELEMPSKYDDFSEKAHRDYPAPPAAAANRALLEQAMAKRGFSGLSTEWWHFDAPGWEKAPLLDVPFEALK